MLSAHDEPTKMKKKTESRAYPKYRYESPLNAFKRSLEDLTTMVSRLTDEKLQKLSAGQSSRTSSLQDSVIIINDSDSETNDGDNETNDKNVNNTSVSIIECSSKLASPSKRRRKLRISTKQDAKEPETSSHNDSSILCLSNTQESLLDGENIAPTQTEDDVVELWSCLKQKPRKVKIKKKRSSNFIIDKKPNLSLLSCLMTEMENSQKKKKKKKKLNLLHKETPVKPVVKPFEQKTLKHLSCNRRKRPCENDASNSNEPPNKKKIISNEGNHKTNSKHKLREIIVDGCNVAMAHTNGKEFSEKGIEIVVNHFKNRGHVVKVFLPQHIRRKEYLLLEKLYKEGIVIFTPSRSVAGRQITSYDDRFILKYATLCGGIVISSDQYRDLYKEKPEWRDTIMNRLLIPTFVGDYIMFPEDPLGKFGPNLERFLRH
ncbi:probable ribonuclease ZC3H12B [Solenopsis invicta]|uniref:probable ribonuclease ZC3H12B n=1 Tax=Solenopsis invicta TaxID=13686 RepID=UPI00193E80C8|nr:probable ribonuclease ZC3H12B [Solenopsis invicta]